MKGKILMEKKPTKVAKGTLSDKKKSQKHSRREKGDITGWGRTTEQARKGEHRFWKGENTAPGVVGVVGKNLNPKK